MDEYDLKWLANENNISVLLKQFHEKFVLKSLGFFKLSHSSEMQNDALMHRDGLEGEP